MVDTNPPLEDARAAFRRKAARDNLSGCDVCYHSEVPTGLRKIMRRIFAEYTENGTKIGEPPAAEKYSTRTYGGLTPPARRPRAEYRG